MGSEQHAASLKNRLYKQKIPEGSHPPGSFLYQFCAGVRQAVGAKALQPLGQGGEVAAGVIPRSGKRGQCQNQQKIRAFRTLCRLRGAAVGASGSGLSGRRCAVRASAGMALPYFCQIVPAACGRPEAARRIISSSHKAGVSALATVRTQQPFRPPRNSTVSSARSRHPAAKSAPTRRCAARTRVSFAGTGPPLTRQTFALSFSRTFASA